MFVFPHSLKWDAAVARQSRCRALAEAVEIYFSRERRCKSRASATWTREGEQRWVNNIQTIDYWTYRTDKWWDVSPSHYISTNRFFRTVHIKEPIQDTVSTSTRGPWHPMFTVKCSKKKKKTTCIHTVYFFT